MTLKAAAQRVIDSWESGDLAAAVRDLQDALEEDTLTAAAPDLLAALRRIVEYGFHYAYRSSETSPYAQARAAIAKAEGR